MAYETFPSKDDFVSTHMLFIETSSKERSLRLIFQQYQLSRYWVLDPRVVSIGGESNHESERDNDCQSQRVR